MTKMSQNRKLKKGVATKRNFNQEELLELSEMQRLVNGRKWEAAQIRANTALVPGGQRVLEELEAISRLLENSKNIYVSQRLLICGYPMGTLCDINFSTGEIVIRKENGS